MLFHFAADLLALERPDVLFEDNQTGSLIDPLIDSAKDGNQCRYMGNPQSGIKLTQGDFVVAWPSLVLDISSCHSVAVLIVR